VTVSGQGDLRGHAWRPAVASGPCLPPADEIQAISLDLDDTLWPVLPALLKAEQDMHAWLLERAPATAAICSIDRMREIRLLVAMANADRAHDMGWLRLESLRHALREGGDDPALAVGAFNVFLDGRQRVTLYEDVHDVLQRWKARYKLLVVTNGNADIGRIGIGHFFDVAVAAHELGVGKPDRRIFQHACDLAGVLPAHVLHVGDDIELDVRGARRSGLHAAWLRRPDLDEQLRRSRKPPGEAAGENDGHLDGEEPVFRDLEAIDRALQSRLQRSAP
jgi:FMN hydrolase / 5-amino-6-(5-phospho-D-ribitylamino)uracil phosphatase